MSFPALAYKVMIASPSDVTRERIAIRDCIHEWNSINAEERQAVLLPVGWDTHASPSMAAPAQEVINSQVLAGCDLLVAVFWTRIGTPTSTESSGSVEEIRRHLKSGKPAMLYFSDSPVELSSVNHDQYAALVAFREECKAVGLIEQYSSVEEFRSKLSRQLAHVVQRDLFAGVSNSVPDDIGIRGAHAGPSLSRQARVLLYHAAQDPHGQLMKLNAFGGRHIQTNGTVWPNEMNAREEASWAGALEELQRAGLIVDLGYKGEVFSVTRDGFALADQLGVPALE